MGWGGRWEGGSGWGTHVNPWLIHVNVWQKPSQYCKVISLQLIKINEKKKRKESSWGANMAARRMHRTEGLPEARGAPTLQSTRLRRRVRVRAE